MNATLPNGTKPEGGHDGTQPSSVELLRFRDEFPVFRERNYLATQCMGPFPRQAYRDVEEFLATRHMQNRLIETWVARIDEVTELIERVLNAPSGSVALRDNATACQAALAASISASPRRNRIIVTALDFHSSLHLWSAQAQRGFDVVQVASPDGIHVPAEAIINEIDERTAVVAVSLVSRNSALLDAAPVIARARQAGAITVFDCYQAVGVLPIDVQQLEADVIVAGTHKWLSGETGLGFMYVRPELAAQLHPAYPGWFGHADLPAFASQGRAFVDAFSPREGARRFQQGSPGVLPIYGSRAGLKFVLEAGVENIRARNVELCARLSEGAEALKIPLVTPRAPGERAGSICLDVGPDPEVVVQALADRGIDVDQRRRMMIRVAPHACTTRDECDQFLESLSQVLQRRLQ
jgi:kynureninase